MSEVNILISEDKYLNGLLEKLGDKSENIETAILVKELEEYIFKKYCCKGYLKECEPEYCSNRILDACNYIKIFRHIQKVYNTNIIKERVRDE